ncbi:MAG: hypothetical protein Q4A24_09100 [Akkermansia sp.]|nr:hypothetical protein [Akkermansia sp.]
MKVSVLILAFLWMSAGVSEAICLPEEEARVHTMMQAAEKPNEVFFTELCRRNFSTFQAPLQWEEEDVEYGRSSYDRTERYTEARYVELYHILNSGQSVEQKTQAYRALVSAHPEMAEELMEILLMQYYLAGKQMSDVGEPLPHTREKYRQMAEQLFRAPELNWGMRGKSGMTPAGVIFRFAMGTKEVEPLVECFCRYAAFNETDCLYDHPAVALATMADCPQALRILLARGNTTPELAAYCIRMMQHSHAQHVLPRDIAATYCGLFYLSNDCMDRDRLKLSYAMQIRNGEQGHALLDLLLPLLTPQQLQGAAPEPVVRVEAVAPSYSSLQQRCPALLPCITQQASPPAEAPAPKYADPYEEEQPEPVTEIPDYSEEEVERAVARMSVLLRADSVVSFNQTVMEVCDATEQEDTEMKAAAAILYLDTYKHKRIPACVAQYELVQQYVVEHVADWLEAAVENAQDDTYTAENLADDLQSFVKDVALAALAGARYLKWEKLLMEQTREVDIAVPLQLQGNETEVCITVAASAPGKVQSVTYKREGQGGRPWAPVVRYRSYVPVGGASTLLLEPAYQQPVVYAEQEVHDFIERTPISVYSMNDFALQIGHTLRYVGYAPDYAVNGACSQWRVFEADGSLSEESILPDPVEKVIPVIIRLVK